MYIYLFLLIGSFVDFKVTLVQKNGNVWHDLVRAGDMTYSYVTWLIYMCDTAEILKRALFLGSHFLQKSPICVCPRKRVFIQISPLQCFRHSRNPEKSPILLALICEKALFVYVPAKETWSDHFYWSLKISYTMRPPQQKSRKGPILHCVFAKQPYWCMSLLQKSTGQIDSAEFVKKFFGRNSNTSPVFLRLFYKPIYMWK